jgi:transposase InsO family protein
MPERIPGERQAGRERLNPRSTFGTRRVVQTPFQAPNANAHAERFVRSVKHERLDRIVPLGERHFRRALKEFVDHYHRERNHQGLENRLIEGSRIVDAPAGFIVDGSVAC